MNAFVSIVPPEDSMMRGMLISSLSFIHPMKIIRNDGKYITFKLFDCSDEEQLDDRLTYLGEASSVDFSYTYAFVD